MESLLYPSQKSKDLVTPLKLVYCSYFSTIDTIAHSIELHCGFFQVYIHLLGYCVGINLGRACLATKLELVVDEPLYRAASLLE